MFQPGGVQAATEDSATAYLKAANRTAEVAIYQSSLKILLSNFSPDLAKLYNIEPDTTITFTDLSGIYNGRDSSTRQRFDPLIGSYYPSQGLEMLSVGGSYFLHGPAPMFGAPQDRWYTDPSLQIYLPALDQRGLIRGLMQADLKPLKYQRDDQIDSQRCRTHAMSERKAAAKAFESLLGGGQIDITRVNNPVVNTTICGDGYIHRIFVSFDLDCGCKDSSVQGNIEREQRVSYHAAPPAAPKMVVTYSIEARFFEFAKPVVLKAPRDALPLEAIAQTSASLEALVFNGGNIRAEPSLRGRVLGQLHAGQRVELIERSADARWYYVNAPEATGWVSSSLLTLPEGTMQLVPVTGQAASSNAASTSLSARVYNGGNVRATAQKSGKVLDQINAGEMVALIERSRDGMWYRITNPRGVTGWVHRSLLTIEPDIAKRVPIAK